MSRRPMAKVLSFLVALTALSASKGTAGEGAPAAVGNAAAYRLAPGDRVTLTVLGQADLSGEFLVDSSGTIPIPFVGDVEVQNRSLAEAQAAVAVRLANGILKNPAVNIRLLEYRPIYVSGDVRTPGSYPFRLGSTVKSAVAMAGGYGVSGVLLPVATADFLAADERRRDLRVQRVALLARQARLTAQRDGAASFRPPEAPDRDDAADLADLVASEKEAFSAAREALFSQISLLRAQKPRIEREIAAIKIQKSVEEEQADAIHTHSQQYIGLMKQGLGLATQDLQFKLNETTRRSDVMRLTADISRLEMDSGEIDIKIATAQAAFTRQAGTELEDVRQRLKQVGIALATAEQVAAVRKRQIGGFQEGRRRVVEVARVAGGRVASTLASEATPLLPGDIVDVKLLDAGEAGWNTGDARPPASEGTVRIADAPAR